MHFTNVAMLASATLASASNLVTLVSMDDTDRTIVWTGNTPIEDTSVPGGQNVSVELPDGYIGNLYSVSDGAARVPGMLAEFAFDSYAGLTYFDVSAIVNPEDKSGVYQMWPVTTQDPVSGCQTFKCENAYYLPDDKMTKSGPSGDFIVTLGAGPMEVATLSSRSTDENHPREAVLDPHYKPALKQRLVSVLRWARRA